MRRRTLLIALLLAGCGGDDRPREAATAPPAAVRVATPAQVTAAQFASLRWLEGGWRGEDGGGEPFYERYTFVDDSTIRAQSSPDSTFPSIDGASEIRLRGGHVTTGEEVMEWTVTAIGDRYVRFDPVRGASNAFEWRSDSDTSWTATLSWRDADAQRHERTYTMRRTQ